MAPCVAFGLRGRLLVLAVKWLGLEKATEAAFFGQSQGGCMVAKGEE